MGLFGLGKKKTQITQQNKGTRLVDGFMPCFNALASRNESDIYRTALNSLATHCSKLRMIAKVTDENGREVDNPDNTFAEIFRLRPNKYFNASSFLQKAAYNYFEYNNCFIYLNWGQRISERTGIIEYYLIDMWVLDSASTTIEERDDSTIYLEFFLPEYGHIKLPYEDIIHLQRNVNYGSIWGNSNPLAMVLNVINTNDQGIISAIESSNFVRFIVEYTTVLSEPAKIEKAQNFKKAWLSKHARFSEKDVDDAVGVIVTDSTGRITQVNSSARYEPVTNMPEIHKRVYAYLGTNTAVVNNDYSEDQFQAVFESSIEIFAIRLEQEFSYKCFTQNQRSRGNRIAIQFDRLSTMSMNTRLRAAEIKAKMPIVRPNDINELLYLPQTPEGDIYYSTLNFVQTSKQNTYQGVKGESEDVDEGVEHNPESEEDARARARRLGFPQSQVVQATVGDKGWYIAPRGITKQSAKLAYANARATGRDKETAAKIAWAVQQKIEGNP